MQGKTQHAAGLRLPACREGEGGLEQPVAAQGAGMVSSPTWLQWDSQIPSDGL